MPAERESSPFQAEGQNVAVSAENGDLQRQSAGLRAVQTDRFRKIPLDAVLHDFQSTMDALGADEQTRSEVVTYLQAVGLQGSKENPEVPFMKHTLRTAAGTLDQFITRALGQPSQVVKEWVDALLLQDIDFHIQETPAWLANPREAAQAQTASAEAPEVPTPAFDKSVKVQLKRLIAQSRTQFKKQGIQAANATLQQALDLLEPHNQPLWTGKVWQLKARLSDKAGDWQQAASAYERAAIHFETGGRVDWQAESLHQAASILDEQGQYEQAAAHYQAVVALDSQQGDALALTHSLNALGSLQLRQGSAANAVATLERASREALKASVEPGVHSDVLNNLGAAYRAQQNHSAAIQAFRQSLRLATSSRDKTRYMGTLRQLAATYVENSQPELAIKALQRLQELQAS
jgi:tetratricopeptide (TPR) repeat protein